MKVNERSMKGVEKINERLINDKWKVQKDQGKVKKIKER